MCDSLFAKKSCGFKLISRNLFGICIILFSISTILNAQSTDQNLPTPITSNQINGEIKARDIGDSRLTSYYFVFNGNRGDIFINVVTTNLNGDLDIFTLNGLKPKTKITLYSDNSDNETGRVIYMRKAEKLILRIQGRTPNDDPATFQIKFAGSFEPLKGLALNEVPKAPEVSGESEAKVKVNSVGTIIEQPKPIPEVKEVKVDKKTEDVAAAKETKTQKNKVESLEDKTLQDVESNEVSSTFDPTKKVEDILKQNNADERPKIIITDPLKDKSSTDSKPKEKELTVDLSDKKQNVSAIVRIEREPEIEKTVSKNKVTNPLAKINLKVELKNGDKFERSMIDVLSMNVIQGVLTIVTKDGKITEYSILDVVKMVIE